MTDGLIQQHSCAEGFGEFEGGEQAEELLIVAAARADAFALGGREAVAQDEVEEIVVVGGRRERQFARVGRARRVVGGEACEGIEEVVCGQVRGGAREFDGQAQFEEAQAVGRALRWGR
jgi:hypothetical protein